MDGGGGDGLFTLGTMGGGGGRLAAGTGKLGAFFDAAGGVGGGGESEREKETPAFERVAGESLSLEKSEGGAGLEGCGTAKE